MFRFARYALIAAANLIAWPAVQAAVPTAPTDVLQMSDPLFKSVEGFWSQQIAALGGRYRPTKLTWFTTPLNGVCGIRATVVGPFYCPTDESVYLDQKFLTSTLERARDDGGLAIGYVIAHEVAHHIQNITGTTGMVVQARSRTTPEMANRILTTMELQADCYAGLWARWASAHNAIRLPAEPSTTLDSVAAISRERQHHLTSGVEMLDPLTHGTADQRLRWFRRGLDSGRFDDCDTFGAQSKGDL